MRRALPTHIGFIPDGNRRWAVAHGYEKQDGYEFGIAPGVAAIKECINIGIPEISIYGFTQDNTKRPAAQVAAFRDACVAFARAALSCNVALLVVGDDRSSLFPDDLRQFVTRTGQGMKVNLLINYGWEWDLAGLKTEGVIRSDLVPRMDSVIRWGAVGGSADFCQSSPSMLTSSSWTSTGQTSAPTTYSTHSNGSKTKIARSVDENDGQSSGVLAATAGVVTSPPGCKVSLSLS